MNVSRADQRRVAVMERLLDEQAHGELETFVRTEFDKDLLGEELLNAARALRAPKVVIFLSTLGVANLPHPDAHALWLVCYQSIAQRQEFEGFRTLPEYLPVKWVVRQMLGQDAALSLDEGTAVADWLDAIELTIDQARLDLSEVLVHHLSTQTLPNTAWLAIAKTLLDREFLLRYQPDLQLFAQCLERVVHQLHRDGDGADVLGRIVAAAARCFLEVGEPARAKAMALNIQESNPLFAHERAMLVAEACCKANELVECIVWLDRGLVLALEPEVLRAARDNHQQSKLQACAAPTFDPASAAKALMALEKALEPCGHKVFLVSGSLLGYAREGRLLAHDKDIDVGVIGWINQFDVLNAIMQSRQFIVRTMNFGEEDMYVIPIGHIETQTAIDIFFYRTEGEKLVTGVTNEFGYLQKFSFTRFDLSPIDFLGITLHAPSDIELNLRENYGDGWRVSDPDYISHLESPSTVDAGGLVYQIVGRLTILGAINGGKSAKLSRALTLMERQSDRPGGMDRALIAQLRDLALRLDEIMSLEDRSLAIA